MTEAVLAPETNSSFARKVGCNHTTASRLRSGQRMPSGKMLFRICEAYGLNKSEALSVFARGSEEFSKWLRANVFSGSLEQD